MLPNGTNLYSDRGGGLGCRLMKNMKKQKDVAKESVTPVMSGLLQAPVASEEPATSVHADATAAAGPMAPSATAKSPRPDVQIQPLKAPQPFPAASLRVPVLMVNQHSAKSDQSVGYAANLGEIVLADLAVSYVPAGTGPEVVTDSHFGGLLDVSLRTAVAAAAKSVGYDPRFLRVRLSVRTSMLQSGLYIDGPSAGAILAVGVTSALLGDPIRPEVCMSGTIDEDQAVGSVGELEEKIKGCRQRNYREMVVPFGQTSMDLALKGMGGEIKITEVSTLGAAYHAATGQSIRTIPSR
ncbi:MAG: hypothetical protein AUH96_00080 [Nitrospirae bacterium 13_2_20CM_2_61_4]|nr:MAG: hypothetical protein AUH96_00080 [Nitrospirae bacterium 13_2_20CM_2_61_4]